MVSNVWANWAQKCGNEYDHESDQNGNENNDANADYEDDDDDDNYGDDWQPGVRMLVNDVN